MSETDIWKEHAFPYVRTFVSETEARATYQRLREYHVTTHESPTVYRLDKVQLSATYERPGNYAILPLNKANYFELNYLTDYFTEPSRMRARRYNRDTPLDTWVKHRADGTIDSQAPLREQRDALYNTTIEASNFRLNVACTLLDHFCPRSIFDPCAGHGDRAFAAYSRSYVQRYEACDPNALTCDLITKGLETLDVWQQEQDGCCSSAKKTFVVRPLPVEDFFAQVEAIPELKTQHFGLYDMVFTSPPYGDTEIYFDSSSQEKKTTQSICRHPDAEEWYTCWLRPVFQRAWNLLRAGGVMAISINNVRDHKSDERFDRRRKTPARQSRPVLRFQVVERLVADLSQTLTDNVYVGVMSYADRGLCVA